MGKHGNKDNGQREVATDPYQPKHAGGQDAWDWSKELAATADTVEIPKVDPKEKK